MIDADGRPVEIELKYDVADLRGLERLLATGAIGPFAIHDTGEEVRTEDFYLDTADRRILAGGYVLRLRRTRGRIVVTLKSAATVSGAEHRRTELEAIGADSPDPRTWPRSEPRDLVIELAGDVRLVELGAARQVRRLRELVADGTRVELSLDRVEVVADGTAIDAWDELEAELLAGDEARLGELAAVLDATDGLAPSATSKMERALAATERHRGGGSGSGGGGGGGSGAPKHPGVLGDDPLAEAGRKVLRFHLDRMIARETGTRLGDDPEHLHKMRVATRRMRAAWRVFGPAFRPGRTKGFRDHLRVVADRLGAVRDLDVLVDAIVAYRDAVPGDERPGLEPLLDELRDQRFEARILLMRELDSADYTAWLDEYREFTRHEGLHAARTARTVATEPHRVCDTMASAIWAAYERVRAYERALSWADVETLHSLRIEAKRLRYTIEYVREALSPDAAPFIARIVALQDHLGELNDAVVAGSLARSFLVRMAGSLDEAATVATGRFIANREREVERLRETIGFAWAGIAEPDARELLGRVTASL